MRKSNWTPSIVPRADDQDIYLVVDDLAGLAGYGGMPTLRQPILRSSSSICSRGNTKTRSAFSVSIRLKAGRGTSRKTSPASCAGVAICSCATCRHPFRTSSNGMRRPIAS